MDKQEENRQAFREIPGMFEGPIMPLLIRLGVPMLAGQIVQLIYNITDTIFISRIDRADPSLVGGVGIIFPIMFLSIAVAAGMMTGVSSLVARAIGEKNYSVLDKVAESGMAMALFFSFVIISASYLFDGEIVSHLGAKGDYARVALDYLRFIIPAASAAFITNVLLGILQGEGQVKYIMKVMFIGTGLNILLDPIFIFLLGWGVKGAAAATTAAQFIAALYAFTPFLRQKVSVKIHWKVRNISLPVIGKIGLVGFPQALGMMLMAISYLFLNRIVMYIDPLALTAFSLCGRFDQAVLMPSFALGGALITIMGQNGGRGLYERCFKAWHRALLAGAVAVLVLAALVVLFAKPIYSSFSGTPEVVRYAVLQTRIVEFFFLLAMVTIVSRSGFQAMGYPTPALFLVLLRLIIVAIPLAYLLVYRFDWGMYGVWAGLMGGSIVSGGLSYFWLRAILKQIIRGEREFRAV
ncbi:MAG: MATE family efflux transporter [Spirochaetales bacterium]|nr:MATE family efflux transporter [Spirochaetales bacterium]